jgi:hypothetical protein
MSKGNTFETELLGLIFNADPIAGLAEDDTSSPVTSLYVSLHATWPGEAGTQTTGEVSYGSYARVAVARDSGGWTITGNSVSPTVAIEFQQCVSSTATANFFAVGTDVSGTGKLLYAAPIGAAPTIITGAASDTITSPAHGLNVDDPVVFWAGYGVALPGSVVEGTVYYVETAPSADTFTISATLGGAVFNITVSGAGGVQLLTPISISTGVTPILTTATEILED